MPFTHLADKTYQLKLKDFNATKTHCVNGHALTGDNVAWHQIKGRRKYPICRECRRISKRRYEKKRG